MEVSVSFTDGSGAPAGGWQIDDTVLGKAYIPRDGVIISGPVAVRYERYPWIEKFELDGIRPAPAKRTGIGSKGAKGFVKSLSTIYSGAYDDYYSFGGDVAFDARGYFANAAEHFLALRRDAQTAGMFRKFTGFAENMWREGDAEMLDAVMEAVIPRLMEDRDAWAVFMDSVTEEFRRYIDEHAGAS